MKPTHFPRASRSGSAIHVAYRATSCERGARGIVVPSGPLHTDVEARGVDSAGDIDGAQFTVNAYTASNQIEPAVAALGDGRYAVVWNDQLRAVVAGRVIRCTLPCPAAPAGDCRKPTCALKSKLRLKDG